MVVGFGVLGFGVVRGLVVLGFEVVEDFLGFWVLGFLGRDFEVLGFGILAVVSFSVRDREILPFFVEGEGLFKVTARKR